MNPIMQPEFRVLTPDTIARIIGQAIEIIQSPGIKVGTPEALELLQSFGASVINSGGVVKIPEELVLNCLDTVPRSFSLFNGDGKRDQRYTRSPFWDQYDLWTRHARFPGLPEP